MTFNHLHHERGFQINLNTNVWDWILVVAIFGLTLLVIYLNITLIRPLHEYCVKNSGKIKSTVIYSVATIFTFTISSISTFVGIVLCMISNDFNHHFWVNDIFSKLGFGIYLFSQTLMIFLFVNRIDRSFKDSIIAYSRFVINTLHIASIIFVIFYIFVTIFLILEVWQILFILTLIWIVLYFVISSILCFLFIHKVQKLIMCTQCVDTDFLNVVIKHAILIPIAICSSFICFNATVFVSMMSDGTLQMTPITVFWVVMDCTVSISTIYLLFIWNEKHYLKWCKWLHTKCAKRKTLQLHKTSENTQSTTATSTANTASSTAQTASSIDISVDNQTNKTMSKTKISVMVKIDETFHDTKTCDVDSQIVDSMMTVVK